MSDDLDSVGFPLFPSLPQEIQDQVWEIAAKPFPGDRHLHTFYAVSHYFDQEEDADRIGCDGLRFGPAGTLRGTSFGLMVPREKPDRPNTSAYRATRGLWTACRASRRAFARQHPKNEWWSELPGPEAECPPRAGPGDYLNEPDSSHTAVYIDQQGRANHVTISPYRDVVHLPASNLWNAIDWFYHYAGDHVPLLDKRDLEKHPENGDAHPSFLGMDIALDFNPHWFNFLPGSLVDEVEVFHNYTNRTVWFIDYRLRRRQASEFKTSKPQAAPSAEEELAQLTISGSSEDIQMFYSCGYVFTEVKESHQHLWEIEGENSDRSVFDFFPRLGREHNERLEEIYGSKRMRVLAREVNPGDPCLPTVMQRSLYSPPSMVR